MAHDDSKQSPESASTSTVGNGPVQHGKDFFFLPVPKRLRFDEGQPFRFTLYLNLVFAISTTFRKGPEFYLRHRTF